jgi:putative dehydrogenase
MARVLAQDYAPRAALRILTKDVGLFVDAAHAQGHRAPVAAAALAAFRRAVDEGWGEEDDCALIKSYR